MKNPPETAETTGTVAADVADSGRSVPADPIRGIANEALRIVRRASAVAEAADRMFMAALDLTVAMKRFEQGIDPPQARPGR